MATHSGINVHVPASRHTDVLTYLLEQPNELIGEVVQWLGLRDLLNLRATSRKLHELVHSHEEAICARYCRRLRLEHYALQLPSKIHGLKTDLLHHIELKHRCEPIRQLAAILADHIAAKLHLRSALSGKEVEELWRERKSLMLQRQLFPWLFAFNSFLECLRIVFLEGEEAFDGIDDDTYWSMHNIYDLDQQRIIEDMSPCNEETIRNISAAYSVLLGVGAAKNLSLSTKSPKYPFASIKKIMILRGLVPLTKIYSEATDLQRKHELVAASDRVQHGGGRRPVSFRWHPLQSIRHLDTARLSSPSMQSSRRIDVRNWFVDRQEVWFKAAFAVVQRLGMTQEFPPNCDQCIHTMLAEEDDPDFDLGSWKTPDPP